MRVICTLQNASNEIGGHILVVHTGAGGMVSENMERAVAERLLRIPGYSPWTGSDEAEAEIDKAIRDYTFARRSPPSQEEAKAQIIEELQRNLEYAGQEMARQRHLIEDLRAESAKLKELLGPPTVAWKKEDLLDYAASKGVQVQSNDDKETILEAIARHVASEPQSPQSSQAPTKTENPSMEWKKDDLLNYAKVNGIEVQASDTKETILAAISEHEGAQSSPAA